MKDNIDQLISIAQDINLLNEAAQLSFIKQRFNNDNCELILPLVGEFSAGKTTLINSLTDSKQLETATKPTTATIYEIHFGCDGCYAEVYYEQGEMKRIDDISTLKNESLGDSLVVNVFDTASRIPTNIVLVDTPGLSSEDVRHKQTLVDFLPKADGILLVVDVNQQITRSLTDFINMMNLARRPVFLVITKCDTKSPAELEQVKQYIAENIHLPLSRMVCVSAAKGDLNEFYNLLDAIQNEKGKILSQVNDQRLKDIVNVMLAHIDELLKVSSSDKELENAIRKKELELKKMENKLERLVEASQSDIEDEERRVARKFQDVVQERLDVIVGSKSNSYDTEAVAAINSVTSICLNEFKDNVEKIIASKANDQKGTDNEIPTLSLKGLDISHLSVSGLSYDLNLDSIGHEYDGWIATGVKVAAAAAVVATTVASGGAAGASALEAVDIASDVGSILSNEKHISRVQQTMEFIGKATEQYDNIEQVNVNTGQRVGTNKGVVEGLVGMVTDKTLGKPQRRRAIRIFIDDTLAPQFKRAMSENAQKVTEAVSISLREGAEVFLAEKKQAMESLLKKYKEKKDSFRQRLEQLRDYQNILLTL